MLKSNFKLHESIMDFQKLLAPFVENFIVINYCITNLLDILQRISCAGCFAQDCIRRDRFIVHLT